MKVLSAFVISFFAAVPGLLPGQTPWETVSLEELIVVLKTANTNMANCRTLEVDIQHRITDLSNGTVVLQSSGYFKRKDSTRIRSRIFGVETIQNKEFKVVVDSQEMSVLLARPSSLAAFQDVALLEHRLREYPVGKITKGNNAKGLLTYQVDFSGEDFPMALISISLDGDFMVAEYSVDLNQSSNERVPDARTRTQIAFSNYRLNESIPDGEFSTDHVIQSKQSRIGVTGRYANYEFINMYR